MPTPTFHDVLRERFVVDTPHVAECGMRIAAIDASGADVVLPFRAEWIGDIDRGLLHPGIVTTLVDSACGAAVLAAIGRFEPVATLDLRMDYLRAGTRDLDVCCRAECYRLTGSIAFARATVWQRSPAEPIAVSHSAFMRTQRRGRGAGR